MNFKPISIEGHEARFLVTFELLGGSGRGVWKSNFMPELKKLRSAEFDIVYDFFLGHNAVVCDDSETGISISGKDNIIIGRIFDQYEDGTSWLQIPGAGVIAFDLDVVRLKVKILKLIVPFDNLILTPC